LQYKYKKNLYRIIFLVILLSFIISLAGCDWFSLGLLNIFDPQAQIRISELNVKDDGTVDMKIFSLNQAEFIVSGFEFDYYNGDSKLTSLDRTIGAYYYVAPSSSPGEAGAETEITDLCLYSSAVLDYVKTNLAYNVVTCDFYIVGSGAGHDLKIKVAGGLSALGVDNTSPTAKITVAPDTTGIVPFTVTFDAYGSTDNRGIASYSWDFGDGTSATGVMPAAHTYTVVGTYTVKLTVTDYFGNVGVDIVTITVNAAGVPSTITIEAVPTTVTAGGTSAITVSVKDAEGNPVTNGTTVTFSTTFGTLSSYSETTLNGIATTVLTLPSTGSATVTAISGSVSNTVIVTCPAP
jgi:PKD repeat protein